MAEDWVKAYGFQHHKKEAFLSAYVKCGTISKAAEYVGIPRCAHYDWLQAVDGEKYAKAFQEAQDRAVELFENELYRRAMAGTADKASMVGLIVTLKSLRPEKYKENVKHEHTGSISISTDLESARKRAMEMRSAYEEARTPVAQ